MHKQLNWPVRYELQAILIKNNPHWPQRTAQSASFSRKSSHDVVRREAEARVIVDLGFQLTLPSLVHDEPMAAHDAPQTWAQALFSEHASVKSCVVPLHSRLRCSVTRQADLRKVLECEESFSSPSLLAYERVRKPLRKRGYVNSFLSEPRRMGLNVRSAKRRAAKRRKVTTLYLRK